MLCLIIQPHLLVSLRQATADSADPRTVSESTKIWESGELVFGERLLQNTSSVAESFELAQTQYISMQLYEGRIASLQRAVAFYVMFHEMASLICNFWSFASFGFLRYRIDRTQSIMRVATTASPVSGADVRHKLIQLRVQEKLTRMKAGALRFQNSWRLSWTFQCNVVPSWAL